MGDNVAGFKAIQSQGAMMKRPKRKTLKAIRNVEEGVGLKRYTSTESMAKSLGIGWAVKKRESPKLS